MEVLVSNRNEIILREDFAWMNSRHHTIYSRKDICVILAAFTFIKLLKLSIYLKKEKKEHMENSNIYLIN